MIELGVFATRIRTGLGEELSLPNAVVIGNVTRDYSRALTGAGYIVDTTVTIGYDTPWRQVEAMLRQAARKTPGILELPAPQVFQTGLSDFYPVYRLVCQATPGEPRSRADLLTRRIHSPRMNELRMGAVRRAMTAPAARRDWPCGPDDPRYQ